MMVCEMFMINSIYTCQFGFVHMRGYVQVCLVCVCLFRCVVYIRADINRQTSCSEMNERADCVEADEVA